MVSTYSYIDKAGKVVIDAGQYEGAAGFSDGLAAVKVAHKGWGFIDRTGSLVIPPRFGSVSGFSEGLAAVLLDDKWGFINKTGTLVIESQFDWAGPFSEGVAVVQRSSKPKRPVARSASPITVKVEVWDLADTKDADRQANNDAEFLLIDTAGKILANLDQKNLEVNIDDPRFSEGLLCVYVAEKKASGYIDKSFEFVIEPKFAQAESFSEGLAKVAVIENDEEKLAFIDKKGNFVIPPKFNTDFDFQRNSSGFAEGLAAVSEGLNPSLMNEETFVYIDKAGEIVLATEFFYAGQFHDGLATVFNSETSRWGFIDKSGKVAIPVKYESANDFSDGLALVTSPSITAARSIFSMKLR